MRVICVFLRNTQSTCVYVHVCSCVCGSLAKRNGVAFYAVAFKWST